MYIDFIMYIFSASCRKCSTNIITQRSFKVKYHIYNHGTYETYISLYDNVILYYGLYNGKCWIHFEYTLNLLPNLFYKGYSSSRFSFPALNFTNKHT